MPNPSQVPMPDLTRILAGIPSRAATPRIDRQTLPDKRGGNSGFENRESSTVYGEPNVAIETASSKSETLYYITVDSSGKETKTLERERTMTTIQPAFTMERTVDGGKETLEVDMFRGGHFTYTLDKGVAKFKQGDKEISPTEFYDGVSKLIEMTAQQFEPQPEIHKAMMAYGAQIKELGNPKREQTVAMAAAVVTAKAASKPSTPYTAQDALVSSTRPGETLRIRTDGVHATITNVDVSTSYSGQQPDKKQQPLEQGELAGMYSGASTSISKPSENFLKDGKVASSLPENVRQQVVAAIRAGVIVMVEHTTDTQATGAAPVAAKPAGREARAP